MGRLKLHVLASGSKGNAAIVEDSLTGEGFAIDCGLCKRDFLGRATEAGFDIHRLRGLVITHAHSDHTKCLGVVLRGLAKEGVHMPLYAHPATVGESDPIQQAREAGLCEVRPLAAEEALSLAGMQVHPFATSHDAAASFGFRVECEGDALGYLTDSGHVPPAAHEALSGVRLLALEANHDAQMLREGPYPYAIKRRIASDAGHLSNAQAAAELEELLGSMGAGMLEAVAAMHVSQENNLYSLAEQALADVLRRYGHTARTLAAKQRTPVALA